MDILSEESEIQELLIYETYLTYLYSKKYVRKDDKVIYQFAHINDKFNDINDILTKI